ncbi:hypothetical protein [Bdellovibrio sp. HCB2-146]|uniref:hypothetical protein n=1 Tax=Bdellovibrio sp. HCB2-146 TaxID=3394362 RepID=UPI0039BD4A0C
MRSLKVRAIGASVLGSLLVGTVWYSLSRPELAPQNEISEVGVQPPASASSTPLSTVMTSDQVVPAPVPDLAATALSTAFKDFSHKEDLSRFSHLSQKALLLPTDQIARKELLADEALIKSLTPLLTTASQDKSEQQLQNAALDLLFAALQSDSRDVAVGVLKDVVASAGVENETLPQAQREQLAGVKAEVLMALSADPKFQDDLKSLFPGPVTGKIWQNVQERQDSNLAESGLSR